MTPPEEHGSRPQRPDLPTEREPGATPEEEPGGRSWDPALTRLLRWYPRAWRQRYAEEFLAMVEDGLDGQRPTWRLTVSVAWAGLRERGRALVSRRAFAWGARGIGAVFGRWWQIWMFASMLAFLPTALEASAPGDRAWQVTAALDALIVVTALIGLTVLAGGLVAFPAFRRFLRAGGWTAIRRRVAWAAGATVVAGGALIALGLGSRSHTYAQLNSSSADFFWFSGTALALMGALWLCASAAKATARQLDLSPRQQSAEAALGVLTFNGITVMASANVTLIAAVHSSVSLVLLAVAGLAGAGVRGRMQMRPAMGRARRPHRGSGPGRHVYRGG
ncbi:MAG: hypothetical protein ACRDOU_15380 [Streptosporangiaceae bacterium]